MKKLENDIVFLRALEPADLNDLYDWENDVSVWPVTSTYIPFNRTTLNAYAQSVQDIFAEKQYRFVIVLKGTGKAIGFVDLFDFEPVHGRAGVGILIAGEENRNKGYGKKALDLIILYAKEILMIRMLFANIGSDNSGSIKVFESSGFVKCGTKKDWTKTPAGFLDEHIYQIVF